MKSIRETFSACINAGSASSASVDVAMRIMLKCVCCDGEVEGDFLKKWAVVSIVCVCSQCVVLCVVADDNNKKVNRIQSFAPSFSTVECCSCSLENDFSAALRVAGAR